MASKILLDAIETNIRASPIHEKVRIYRDNSAMGGLVILGEHDRVRRVYDFIRPLETLWGGGENCSIAKGQFGEHEAFLEVR